MSAPSFDLTGKTAIVTGGYGVLGGSMASALASAGARVAILGRRADAAEEKAAEIRTSGADAVAVTADVLDEVALRTARDELARGWGRLDILINAAGGNVPRARTDTVPVFEMPMDAYDEVVALNLKSTVVATLIMGELMARQKRGAVVNISSMAAHQAISAVMGYSVAKAGIDS
ncbi:MAG TPA: SDR family NAD(P)-dependent oxidoreductase, partial [Gemmatimonadaceae bacterium]|nr:SDR family NAD(P)-dependent oxidoreductase [Gemmatimonadaceae bacterium]